MTMQTPKFGTYFPRTTASGSVTELLRHRASASYGRSPGSRVNIVVAELGWHMRI